MECIVVLIRVHSRRGKSRDLLFLGKEFVLVPNDTASSHIGTICEASSSDSPGTA